VYREPQFVKLCRHTWIMGRQDQWRGTVGENQQWEKEIVVHWEGLFRKITELLQHMWTEEELNIHLEDPVSTKAVRRELHKSNIHCRAAIPKPLITESNAEIRKRCRHDHKTCTSDNWKRVRDMGRWVLLHSFPYIRKYLRVANTQGSLQCGKSGSSSEILGGSVMVSWYSILLVPLLSLVAELLQGSTWTGWAIRCVPWFRCYFRTTMQFSKMTVPPFTQLELFSHHLKSMKVNLNHNSIQNHYDLIVQRFIRGERNVWLSSAASDISYELQQNPYVLFASF
jgi:hypothetical protein